MIDMLKSIVRKGSAFSRSKASLSLPGLAAVAFIAALQFFGVPVLSQVGLQVFDAFQRAAPRAYEDAPVRIVDIDDETIRRFGQWPWPRTDVALLTKRLADAGASAIAFDIVFSEADRTSPARIIERLRKEEGMEGAISALSRLPDNDDRLADTFSKTPVVSGFFLTQSGQSGTAHPKAGLAVSGSPPDRSVTRYSNAVLPLPQLEAAATGNGFVSLVGDRDGIIRRAPLLAMQNGQLLPSLSLDALRTAQGAGSIILKTSDGSGEMGGAPGDMVSIKVGDFEVPVTRAGEMWMHYTQPRPDRVVPAWKILSGKMTQAELETAFGGRIVFVGAGAIGLRDLVATPLQDRDLGVMVHAQAVEQMVLGRFLSQPDWGAGFERALLLVLGVGLALALPRLGATKGAIVGALLVGGIIAGSWYAFTKYQFLLDPTYPVIGITAAYVLETVLTYYREEKQRAYIHNAFDRYLSPELVKRIADDPHQLDLGGEERDMTVLFCDIRSFSRISEKLNPKDIIRFLIAFLTPMCDILLGRKATIDKFIGDAILAFWNAPLDDPDQYENSARAALAMVARLRTLNPEMQAQDAEPWPGDVKIGIGLNAGPCCVGNMGSAQRLSYSLIGDTVNLASRIEGLTKYYGVEIAIGSALQGHLPGFATLVLDKVRVVGRDAPETVYVLLGDEALSGDSLFGAFATNHIAMLDAYHRQDWGAAGDLLDHQDDEATRYGLGKLYALYRDRILIFAATSPGADWDGVFSASEK